MDISQSRIYKALTEEPVHKVAAKVLRLTEEGRDVNFRSAQGQTYLHVVAENADKFRDPRAVPVVYQLCLSGTDVNAQDSSGNTCLHLAVRHEGAFRIIIALLRCGADPSIKNDDGQTAEDILIKETPSGYEENLYWLRKYSPGLQTVLLQNHVDVDRVRGLLTSWCRVVSSVNGTTTNLLDIYCDNQCDNLNAEVVELLHSHLSSNELALATLAGSPKKIQAAGSRDKADPNTTDASYRYHHVHSPEVAQPLLAAAWEQDNYDVIDALMSLAPDTSLMYSNHDNKAPKSLFFHLISGRPRPDNIRIVHRVLRGSDLSRRNHKGQTVLYEAIYEKVPVSVFAAMLTYGVDIASRDYKGRTARDFANVLGYDDYVTAIDHHVIKTVDAGEADVIRGWIIRDYDHISDVIAQECESNSGLRGKLENNRLYTETAQCLKDLRRTQRMCELLMEAADAGDVPSISKHATDHVIKCQNKCGHTLLHRAIMREDETCVIDMLISFPFLIELGDNMHRTPLHYANLFFGGESQVSRNLERLGAKRDALDIYGRNPCEYMKDTLTTHQYNTLIKEVKDFQLDIYLREIDFERGILNAIKGGNHEAVVELVHKAGPKVKMAAYSRLVFDAIDHSQPQTAAYLLQNGCDPGIWKEYESCDVTSDDCVMSQCEHPVVSLQERSKQKGFEELACYIEDLRAARTNDKARSNSDTLQLMSNFGMLAQA